MGSIYIWAAGNGRAAGDNCNYDAYANSIYTIAVPAVNSYGNQVNCLVVHLVKCTRLPTAKIVLQIW